MVVPSEVVYGPAGEKINKGIAYTALDGRMSSSFKIPVSSSYQEEVEARRLKRERAMIRSKMMRPDIEKSVQSTGGSSGGGGSSFGIQQITLPPGEVYILRKTPCNGQITIQVDLALAAQDPRERPLIQPGDTLILRHKPRDELINFGMFTFFTYGITQLFQGGRR